MLELFDRSVSLDQERTTVDQITFNIDLSDYDSERKRLETLGLKVETKEHEWVKWYFHDPEGNQVELVCYDANLAHLREGLIDASVGCHLPGSRWLFGTLPWFTSIQSSCPASRDPYHAMSKEKCSSTVHMIRRNQDVDNKGGSSLRSRSLNSQTNLFSVWSGEAGER